MKAAIFKAPYNIRCEADVAYPAIESHEVLIKVAACGICGSDMHMYRTNAHRSEITRVTAAGQEIPGHEFSGEIVEVGSEVTGFNVGERVVGVGMGGFAQYVPVPANPFQLVKIPEGVTFEEAATTEPLADGLQMLRKAAPRPGENIVVYGVGIIGLGVIQALRAIVVDPGHIVAIDVSERRLALAAELGATPVNARAGDVIEQVRAICGSAPVPWPPSKPPAVDVVIDCAGYIKSMQGNTPLQNALYMLKGQGVGRVVCFGAYEDRFPIDFMPVIHKQITIMGSEGYAAEELVQALAMMASGKVNRQMLISHNFALDEVAAAFEVQGQADAVKVMVRP
ncbi:MAG: alcohol dehydrogenase catalytic domain-containing protein [Gammaproteobacteria bacterium]|uniref:zinc-dependent alcohol dehydrogenase n=1 Tax=Pseudomaricurvus alcaniphilus TaxID=1166482 RepID=UPI00140736CC|nr:alcohol dehydrogenase catalytic domain-containing protein [Pseudomaricurvus alcaniphilus]MBR9910630.1 alcohol dehydrogenase catalytic domain-containing protein [Gammaproteobacteria bacterium]NHN36846.1 alcohol dehydrogenase catalytic domain-containing protein [Pseudomaricurvus alcaniphilus]